MAQIRRRMGSPSLDTRAMNELEAWASEDEVRTKTCKLVCTAFSRVLAQEDEPERSVRNVARWMHSTPTSIQRYKTKGLYIPMLRSRRIAEPFLVELLALVRERNGRSG
jgi:hypothetical protein